MRCRGLQRLAKPLCIGGFLCSGLQAVAPYCVPGGVRVVSGGRATAPIAVFSVVDPLLRPSALWVNQLRNGVRCGIVQPPTWRWVNTIAHCHRDCADRLVGIAISVLCRGSRLDCPPRDGVKDHPWPTGDEVYTDSCCLPGARHAACVHFWSLRPLSTVFSMKRTPRAPS
jgi:hypothetical protein